MGFDVQTEYDTQNNICIVRMIGSPENDVDIDKLVDISTKLWTKPYKVYSISDISKLDFAKFALIDSYQKKVAPIIKEKVVFGVSISSSILADRAAKMFNIVGGTHLVFVASLEAAYEAIKKQQAISGVFVPLDK